MIDGEKYVLALDGGKNDETQCDLPHPEIFDIAEPDTDLLLDDGNIRLGIVAVGDGKIETLVKVGGLLKPHKGVNYPAKAIPISAMSEKDRQDLEFALEIGIDWIAMSFVQRA